MASRVAVVELIARTPTGTLARMEREQRVNFGRLLGIMPGGPAMVLGGFGALLRVIADGSHRP